MYQKNAHKILSPSKSKSQNQSWSNPTDVEKVWSLHQTLDPLLHSFPLTWSQARKNHGQTIKKRPVSSPDSASRVGRRHEPRAPPRASLPPPPATHVAYIASPPLPQPGADAIGPAGSGHLNPKHLQDVTIGVDAIGPAYVGSMTSDLNGGIATENDWTLNLVVWVWRGGTPWRRQKAPRREAHRYLSSIGIICVFVWAYVLVLIFNIYVLGTNTRAMHCSKFLIPEDFASTG